MQVITLLNEKGGVGKTSLSTHVAGGLARKGYKVVLIDCDAQAHATLLYGLPKESGIYDLVVKIAEWRQIIRIPKTSTWTEQANPEGSVWLVPSNIETRGIPSNTGDVFALDKRLTELHNLMKGAIDYVVIDTSPTPSLFHAQIYMATDYFILPAGCDELSYDGIVQSQLHMGQFQPFRVAKGKHEAQLIGIVPTCYRQQVIAQQIFLEKFEGDFPNKVLTPLVERAVWNEASMTKQTLFTYDLKHKATQEVWDVIDYIEEFTQNDQA